MIDILIFSKNRAMQCEFCLRSLKENFNVEKSITVQYVYTNGIFKQGYDKLSATYKDVRFQREMGFENTFKLFVNEFKNQYCLFLCDDDVVINRVEQNELNELIKVYESNKDIHTLSLRMHEHVNMCFPAKMSIVPPVFIEKDEKHLLWDYTKSIPHYCWGYPFAIDGHIYKTEWFKNKLNTIHFHDVNDLEANLNCHRDNDKPLILSFNQTKIFNIQNNFVQGKRQNERTYSVEDLNNRYLRGEKISTNGIYGIMLNHVHGNVGFTFQAGL